MVRRPRRGSVGSWLLLLCACVVVGCGTPTVSSEDGGAPPDDGGTPSIDAGGSPDAGEPQGSDAGLDAGADGGALAVDGGSDAGLSPDAGATDAGAVDGGGAGDGGSPTSDAGADGGCAGSVCVDAGPAQVPPDAGAGCDDPLPDGCPAASSGHVTLCGRIFELETNLPCSSPMRASRSATAGAPTTRGACAVRVVAFDALDLLVNPSGAVPLATEENVVDACGRFRLKNVVNAPLGSSAWPSRAWRRRRSFVAPASSPRTRPRARTSTPTSPPGRLELRPTSPGARRLW